MEVGRQLVGGEFLREYDLRVDLNVLIADGRAQVSTVAFQIEDDAEDLWGAVDFAVGGAQGGYVANGSYALFAFV